MVPISNLSSLISSINSISVGESKKPSFYGLILYKKEHKEFREYILSKQMQIHSFSHDVFIAIPEEPSLEWLALNDIDYYHKMVEEGLVEKNNSEAQVDTICNYFGLNNKGLPYIIMFSDLERKDFNQYCFNGVDINEVMRFFQFLLDEASKFSYHKTKFIPLMIEMRRRFPDLETEISYIEYENVGESLIDFAQTHNIETPEPKLDNNKTKAIRYSTSCKIKCREIAKKRWRESPHMTISEMITDKEIVPFSKNLKGHFYTDETIKNWIRSLSPYNTPGRPRRDGSRPRSRRR